MTDVRVIRRSPDAPASSTRRAFVSHAAMLGAAAAIGVPVVARAARGNGSATLDKVLAKHVAAKDVPFAVGIAASSKGIFYSGQDGEAAPGMAAGPETMMRIFSMTKAVGSMAGMIMIERGKLGFDTPVVDVIPEFAQIQVLDRFDGDKPVLRKPKTPVLVRHLGTHTSGLVYDVWNAKMQKWGTVTKNPGVLTGKREYLFTPLMFDPGTRWDYGTGIDWIGQLVEKVDGRRIDAFCREEIFEPLGMKDTVFEVDPAREKRMAKVKARAPDGGLVDTEIRPPSNPEVYGMGHALYSTPADYLRFCRAVLGKGTLDGKRVLKAASVARMLESHTHGVELRKMQTVAPPVSADFDPFPGIAKTYSFGFMRNEKNVPGMRSAGSQSWAGVCNTHYWIDPRRDVAAVIMTQTLPFVEPRFMSLYADFERAVYTSLA
jgi:CubicO group peptidase (beta-lactamase class C family)